VIAGLVIIQVLTLVGVSIFSGERGAELLRLPTLINLAGMNVCTGLPWILGAVLGQFWRKV
jgi:hypothetical protein